MSDGLEVPESAVEYFWFIGFQWNVLEREPFQIFVRHCFGDNDIPDTWFTGVLTDDYRRIKLKLNAVAGSHPYSIFAKIEKGTSCLTVCLSVCLYISIN